MTGFSTAPGTELVFAHDEVRVWAMTLEPGQSCAFHQHEHDHLILWPQPGRAQAQEYGDDGWPVEQTAQQGFAFFKTVGRAGPLPPHRLRNLEDHPVTHYIVELVGRPSPSAEPRPSQTNGRGSSSRPHTVLDPARASW